MILGHEVSTGNKITIDLNKIIEGRMLIQANSGAGKSYALRKFIEITHGKVQQIIIDVEGEFSSLREKYDFILVSKDGDIPINLKSAELLAKRLMELNVSAIIDLYELKHHERIRFVKIFFDSMINAPKELWHQCLVILDEAHIFSPEKGAGEAESSEAVKDMATRGRKRGIALVCATQRLSKLDKNVVAELNTKLIGRSSLDVDMKRSANELGFTTKENIFSLRNLEKGEFYAFGKGISDKVIKIKIDKVETKHVEAGSSYKSVPSSPTNKIKSLLSKLSDLPQEAEHELKTKEDLQRKIHEQSIEIRNLQRNQKQTVDPLLIQKAKEEGFNKGKQQGMEIIEIKYKNKIKEIKQIFNNIIQHASEFPRTIDAIVSKNDMKIELKLLPPKNIIENVERNLLRKEAEASVRMNSEQLQTVSEMPQSNKLRDGAMRMLKAVAQFDPKPISRNQIGTLSGISAGSPTFSTYISELKRLGWINESNGTVTITSEGLTNAGTIESLPTDTDTLLSMWSNKFRDGCKRMLKEIVSVYPDSISKEELKERSNVLSNPTFSTYKSELERNGLIETNGDSIKATKELFPDF